MAWRVGWTPSVKDTPQFPKSKILVKFPCQLFSVIWLSERNIRGVEMLPPIKKILITNIYSKNITKALLKVLKDG